MSNRGDDVLEQAAAWRADGRKVALATVIATWGSSPRPVGSQMAVDDRSNMVGSVSGGCIEGAVVLEAQKVMGDRMRDKQRHLEIDPDPASALYIPPSRIDELSEPFGNSVNQTRSAP